MAIIRQLCIFCILIINSYSSMTLADTVKNCWENAQSSPYYLLAMGANTHRLKNTTKDVNLFTKSMQTSYDIPRQNICKLPNISRATMQAALTKLAKYANKQRTLFIYFSGHGTVLVGKDGSGDCLDEALVTRTRKVRDNDFIKWVNPIGHKAKQLYVVLDACFSGGFTRNVCPPLKMKYVENLSCPKVEAPQFRHLHATLLAASQERQVAWEGQNNGLFTYHLSTLLQKKYALDKAFTKAKAKVVEDSRRIGKDCKQLPKRYN